MKTIKVKTEFFVLNLGTLGSLIFKAKSKIQRTVSSDK